MDSKHLTQASIRQFPTTSKVEFLLQVTCYWHVAKPTWWLCLSDNLRLQTFHTALQTQEKKHSLQRLKELSKAT